MAACPSQYKCACNQLSGDYRYLLLAPSHLTASYSVHPILASCKFVYVGYWLQ